MKKIILLIALTGILNACSKTGEGLQNFDASTFNETFFPYCFVPALPGEI